MTNTTDMTKTMNRILGLIAKADHPGTGAEEAATFRAHAEELMRRYRLDEENLIASDPTAITPVMHSIFLCPFSSRMVNRYRNMFWVIAEHTGVEVVTRRSRSGEEPGYWADAFGYDADLRMTELLWSSARLVFGSHLEPQVDPLLSDRVNAYNLRQAGMLRKDIAVRMWGENTPANRSRAQRLYVAECAARGEQPALTGLGTDADTYRDAYANGFVESLDGRLRAARDAADSAGGALVFAGRHDRVMELVWTMHPYLRPAPPRPADEVAVVVETPNVPAVKERKQRVRRWTKADEARWQRMNGAAAEAGQRAGGAAAARVQVDRTTAPEARVDDAPAARTALGG